MKTNFSIIGGGWVSTTSNLRASYRLGFDPSHRSRYLGFRLVKG